MSVLLEFSITPLDKGESVGKYVARAVDIIDKSGVTYRVGPMGTCVEGEWDEVMSLVKQCFDNLKQDCRRISITMKADYRSAMSGRLNNKVDNIEEYLGRKVKK